MLIFSLLVKEYIANIGIPIDVLCSLQTSLLCIVGELAGGRSVNVAVSVSGR